MRSKPPRHLHPLSKVFPPVTLEPRRTERQARLDNLGVRSLAEGVGDDGFVLLRHDGAGRVDDVTSRRRVGRDRVDSAQNELLLEVREEGKVALRLSRVPFISSQEEEKGNNETHLVGFDRLILGDDTSTTARSIEEDPVKPTNDLGELPPVDVGDDDILAPQPGDVARQSLDPSPTRVVRPDFSRVTHERTHVGRLTSWRGGHIEHSLVRLGRERDDGEEGRGGLEDVVSSEVLGSSSDGNSSTGEDLQSDLGPSSGERLEIHSAVDERLGEISTTRLEGVDSEGDGTGRVGGVEELNGLRECWISTVVVGRTVKALTSSTP